MCYVLVGFFFLTVIIYVRDSVVDPSSVIIE